MEVPSNVTEINLTQSQEELLLSLERRLHLHLQADLSTMIHQQKEANAKITLQEMLVKSNADENHSISPPSSFLTFLEYASQVERCLEDWKLLYSNAHALFALVEEMEDSHTQVVTKTQALYDSFEHILAQVQALTQRVEIISHPMPHFIAIDGIAQKLGYTVKFGSPTSNTYSPSALTHDNLTPPSSTAVLVTPGKRSVDPTTLEFQQAMEQIDASVTFLEAHPEYKDTQCYLDAYYSLAAGGVGLLKSYAIDGISAANAAILDVLERQDLSDTNNDITVLDDETSVYFMTFRQLAAPALAAVTTQLYRLYTHAQQSELKVQNRKSNSTKLSKRSTQVESEKPTVWKPKDLTNRKELVQVCSFYCEQRVELLVPVFTRYFEHIGTTTDVVTLLRVGLSFLKTKYQTEFRFFESLFGKSPKDSIFGPLQGNSIGATHEGAEESDVEESDDEDENEYFFQRMVFQLSQSLYSVARPQIFNHRDLDSLCEVIQVLQMEIGDSHRFSNVHDDFVPFLQRLIQDTQERLCLCMEIYIRDEIEGFDPTVNDLDYPKKLEVLSKQESNVAGSLYISWYPTLENTLLSLSKVYRFVEMDIFQSFAQEAIKICTHSLKKAALLIERRVGVFHSSLFIIKHLLTLQEQIAPFEITTSISQKSKVLDLNLSTADALYAVLTANKVPVSESAIDIKMDLENELKIACKSFIATNVSEIAGNVMGYKMKVPTNIVESKFLEDLQNMSTRLQNHMPELERYIHLYLRNTSTEKILLQPIKRDLLDVLHSTQIAAHGNSATIEKVRAGIIARLNQE